MNARHRAHHRARRSHRRIAVVAALIVAFFAGSGLVLNHAADLGLHARKLPATIAALFYEHPLPAVLPARAVGPATYVAFDGTLWRIAGDARALTTCAALVDAVSLGVFNAVACRDAVQVLDAQGERVERIDAGWGFTGDVSALGTAADGTSLAIATSTGAWCIDADITTMRACPAHPAATPAATLSATARATLQRALKTPDVDVERFVHDLHSGRLFGASARFAWDLLALALLAMAASGLRVLLRRD